MGFVIMDTIHGISSIAAESAGGSEGQLSPYVFGGFAFVSLGVLLIITTMINVNR